MQFDYFDDCVGETAEDCCSTTAGYAEAPIDSSEGDSEAVTCQDIAAILSGDGGYESAEASVALCNDHIYSRCVQDILCRLKDDDHVSSLPHSSPDPECSSLEPKIPTSSGSPCGMTNNDDFYSEDVSPFALESSLDDLLFPLLVGP